MRGALPTFAVACALTPFVPAPGAGPAYAPGWREAEAGRRSPSVRRLLRGAPRELRAWLRGRVRSVERGMAMDEFVSYDLVDAAGEELVQVETERGRPFQWTWFPNGDGSLQIVVEDGDGDGRADFRRTRRSSSTGTIDTVRETLIRGEWRVYEREDFTRCDQDDLVVITRYDAEGGETVTTQPCSIS
jgi:hypothetical protein